jgi:hypothetical protein
MEDFAAVAVIRHPVVLCGERNPAGEHKPGTGGASYPVPCPDANTFAGAFAGTCAAV